MATLGAAGVPWGQHATWPWIIGVLVVGGLILLAGLSTVTIKATNATNTKHFGVLFGADNRRSTSKLAAFVWTVALAGGAAVLLTAAVLNDAVTVSSLGLDKIPDTYLVLLGGPFAALVAAKAIVQTKVETGTLQKRGASGEDNGDQGGFTANDDGSGALVDTQYLVFNGVLLAYFIAALIQEKRLPELPLSLVGLTGAGAATYVAKKAIDRNPPTIDNVTYVPPLPHSTDPATVQIRGSNLLAPRDQADQAHQVSVTGAKVTTVSSWTGDSFIEAVLDRTLSAKDVTVSVTTDAGTTVSKTFTRR